MARRSYTRCPLDSCTSDSFPPCISEGAVCYGVQILMLYCDKWIGVRSAAEAAASELIRKLNKHAVKAILPSKLPPPCQAAAGWHVRCLLERVRAAVCPTALLAPPLAQGCLLSGACSAGPSCLTLLLFCVRVPVLFAAMESPKFWQAQEGSLKLLRLLAETAPDQLRASLPEVVPRISNYVGDGKKQVMDAAYSGGLLTATIVLDWLGNEMILGGAAVALRLLAGLLMDQRVQCGPDW
jgi:hypothetical protein